MVPQILTDLDLTEKAPALQNSGLGRGIHHSRLSRINPMQTTAILLAFRNIGNQLTHSVTINLSTSILSVMSILLIKLPNRHLDTEAMALDRPNRVSIRMLINHKGERIHRHEILMDVQLHMIILTKHKVVDHRLVVMSVLHSPRAGFELHQIMPVTTRSAQTPRISLLYLAISLSAMVGLTILAGLMLQITLHTLIRPGPHSTRHFRARAT